LRNSFRLSLLGLAVMASSQAHAGELPLYQPAPAWVVSAPLADVTKFNGDSPSIVIFDTQQRIEDGRLWSYVDGATRIASPEMLAQFATLTIPWAPDKGDLIVHELTILRGAQTIDLLAQGQKFTVLRREQTLEQRELTGILTATLAIEGLQVGDTLHLRATTTSKDTALAGRVQGSGQLIAAPARVGFARMRFSWPTASPVRWKVLADGVTIKPESKNGFTQISVQLPVIKQPEIPADAPVRFRHPPLIEISTFTGWPDVSKVMAPLYETGDLIAPDSALAGEVAAIMKMDATPLGRAERALELVQDKVRYLAVGMDGGNYVPQKPARTWEVRYGDCKAKTLLLLSILHAMGIEAEPVLANAIIGDFVPDRLPSAAAFNHILVRATIAGETLWLDGTATGSRLVDIHDTPPFRNVLPVRKDGADLMKIAMHANARPTMDMSVDADETASVDLPSVFDATAVIRGSSAAMIMIAKSQLGEKELREGIGQFFQGFVGPAQFSSATATANAVTGDVTLTAHGVTTTSWFTDERMRKRNVSRLFDNINFAPDRGRPSWTAIPVMTEDPTSVRYRLRVHLPDSGRGYTLEGEPDLKVHLAGYDVSRTMHLADGLVTLEENIRAVGGEVPAAEVASERDKVATAKARAPRVVAPPRATRNWDIAAADPVGATQVRAAEATFAKAIANDPEAIEGYVSRASFRNGISDRRGALADVSRAISIAPTVDLYLQRGGIYFDLADKTSALADAESARKLDPSSSNAISWLATLRAEQGDLTGAIAMLDERIALGGETRARYRETKASVLGEYGDPVEAIKLYDALISERPGSPSLLNGRCWVKGIRSTMLDTALKDCTAAIELSSNTIASLDSRALVWYRMGRYDDAIRDLDAVLAESPELAQSRFMRGVVLTRLHRDADAVKDLQIARARAPTLDKTYLRYGIKP
jgi:tetratricopeptide (TPR) repeat protein